MKFFLHSPYVSQEINKSSFGVKMPRVGTKTMKNLYFPVAPQEEQKRIVAKIEKLMTKINEYEIVENKLKNLVKEIPEVMRASILHAAVQGKMTDQNKYEQPILSDRGITREEYKYKLPENWKVIKISSVSDLSTGNSISEVIKKTKYSGLKNGLNYIGTKDIGFNHEIIYENGVKIPYYEPKFKIARKNATLLCIEGGSAGKKIAILSEDVCFGNKLCSFNPGKYINYKFQYYLLQSPMFGRVFEENISGMIGGVGLSKLKEILVPLPPLEEQLRIVEELDKLFSMIDRLDRLIFSRNSC